MSEVADGLPASDTADVVVVGAGPAGLVSAIAAARQGLSVQVLDRRRAPIDKACGEGLMPDAVAILEDLGVELLRRRPIAGIRYLSDDLVAEGRFPTRPGLGVRRVDLHRALLGRALDLGIEVRGSSPVIGLHRRSSGDGPPRWVVRTDEGVLAPMWVVGADGLHSPMRRWSGLARPARRGATPRFGIRRHVRIEPWTDLVEVHWSDHGEAYVTPVADDEVGVAILWSRPRAPNGDGSTGDVFEARLRAFPALAARLAGAPPTSRPMAAGPLRQRTAGVVDGNLALVGDAGGYVDAITGEGMALAFHQALDLATALVRGDLAPYAKAQARHRRVPDLFTEATLAMARHPGLRRLNLSVLAATPALFDRILAVHAQEAGLWTLPSATVVRVADRLRRPVDERDERDGREPSATRPAAHPR